MGHDEKEVVRQVLEEASDAPHWFDLADGQRLTLMILMAFRKGRELAKRGTYDRARDREADRN